MSTRRKQLAVLGGEPKFDEPLHVGRPFLGDRRGFLKRVEGLLDRNWLTNNGPLVRELESRIASELEVEHCVATCNGTAALGLVIQALGLGGEVIVPSFTFIATVHALQWHGIEPAFCDIDPATHALDPAAVERLVGERTTGILGVHTWGSPCDIASLEAIAERHDIDVFFDAAHAFGCSYGGVPVGRFGRAEVFSFHATKVLNCFEGGAITTRSGELAEKLRLMRNFGFVGYDEVEQLGINAKMSEISAAMGLTSLDGLEQLVAINRQNLAAYREALEPMDGLRLLNLDASGERQNFQYVVVEVDPEVTGLTRDQLVRVLEAENVRARRYFHPGCHRMEPYRSRLPDAGDRLPHTERIAARVLVLPTGPQVDREAIRVVAGVVESAIAQAALVRDRLS